MCKNLNTIFLDYYRCPEIYTISFLTGNLSDQKGFFQFDKNAICYGKASYCVPAKKIGDFIPNISEYAYSETGSGFLPFNLTEVIDNLRYEKYIDNSFSNSNKYALISAIRNAYYLIRPLLPVALRKYVQRVVLWNWNKIPFPNWPVDRTVEIIFEKIFALILRAHNIDKIPFIWFWPDGCQSCAMMTHDVETAAGRDFCSRLIEIDASYQIQSSFEIIPEGRYEVPEDFLEGIRANGCEVCIHGLNHDGHLFDDRNEFLRRAKRINEYAKIFGAKGFRSPVMYRNLKWFDALEFLYDMSLPNVGHLDPQRGGCCTVMPYLIGNILELPLTTIQDYSLFHVLKQYSITLWKQQIELILEKHGLISFIVHPDYIIPEKYFYVYQNLLEYLSQICTDRNIWIALPREIAQWSRLRSEMELIKQDGKWKIIGDGNERARIAYAMSDGEKIVYELERVEK